MSMIPERRAEGIDIRPNIDLLFFQLLRTREMRRTDKSAHRYGHGLVGCGNERLGQTEVDHLHQQMILFLINDRA